jgi:hypothetical protein
MSRCAPRSMWIYGLAGPDGVIRYVGQTRNPQQRLWHHRKIARGRRGLAPVYCWMRKAGITNVSLVLLATCDWDQRNEEEVRWIQHLHTSMAEGGMNAKAPYGHKRSPAGDYYPEHREASAPLNSEQ